MSVNVESKTCAYIGKVWKRMVVSPDVASLLENCALDGVAHAPGGGHLSGDAIDVDDSEDMC